VLFRHYSSNHPGDATNGALKRSFAYPGGCVEDYVVTTRLASRSSYRPLHDLTMCTEAVRVGQMILVLRRQRASIYECKTDSVLFKPRQRQTLHELKLSDLGSLQGHSLRIDQYWPKLPTRGNELAFRVNPATPADYLQTSPELPRRACELALAPRAWHEPSRLAERVVGGNSLLVLGLAGTGKTHLMRELVAHLRARGKRVDIISKTHTASSRAGGVTADHWVRRHVLHGSNSADVVWLDEVSQIDVGVLCQLNKLMPTSVRWLLSGDFKQFPPIGNCFRGSPVPKGAFERSSLLHSMAGGARVTLTTCRRSDPALFEFYDAVASSSLPIGELVASARARFSLEGPARWNLVLSHRQRIAINRRLNELWRPANAFFVPARQSPGYNKSQDMWLW
jgi:hypothetical protein